MDPANYAQFLLESYASHSGGGLFIEKSLGSYVTSMLREESSGDDSGGSREALVELLQEHCNLSQPVAEEALDQIQRVVTHGLPPLGGDNLHESTTTSPESYPASPLHGDVDNLIPGDLLGDLYDQSVPNESARGSMQSGASSHLPIERTDDFPPLHAAATVSSAAPSTSKKFKASRGRKSASDSASVQASDLTAALFRPTRSRQNSVDESVQSTSTAPLPDHAQPYTAPLYNAWPLESAVEIVLSMNQDLSEDAAASACRAAHCDVNLAQYLVEQALTAPPVCRHLLASGCYRADCQFSHDLENHPCMFWMQGRCTKGSSCSFRHGFNETMLEGIYPSEATQPESRATYHQYEAYESQLASESSATPSLQGGRLPPPWESAATFAKVAKGSWTSQSVAASSSHATINSGTVPTVRIPGDVWTPHEHRDSTVFHVADPISRYQMVQQGSRREDMIDLHFQSIKTFPVVLSEVLPDKLVKFSQVWIVTGTGHHVGNKTHQKGGGALENAVVEWLQHEGYGFKRGKDRNGQGGAILVERT